MEGVFRERSEELAYIRGVNTAIEGVLDLIDDCDWALESLSENTDETVRSGLEGMRRKMINHLEKLGFNRLDPVGEDFNPHLHQVVAVEEGPEKEGTILRVHRSGWQRNGELARAAVVTICHHDEQGAIRRKRRAKE